jgi:AcrR family transcriptional regulator
MDSGVLVSGEELKERQVRKETADKLVLAAAAEFNEHGFEGTDTNRIARRAGFAPQTFYRWFEDKVAIFIQVYELWQEQEAGFLAKLLAENAPDMRLVDAAVAHHRAFLVFRRSLRRLSLENDVVRVERAKSRLNQINWIRSWNPNEARGDSELAVVLLQLERLTDALAEGELSDMGLDEAACRLAVAEQISRLRPARKRTTR